MAPLGGSADTRRRFGAGLDRFADWHIVEHVYDYSPDHGPLLGDLLHRQRRPDARGALPAPGRSCRRRDGDGLPVLVADDGEAEVRVEAAIGDRDHAADRLVRLAATALAVATELRVTSHAARVGAEVRWWEGTA